MSRSPHRTIAVAAFLVAALAVGSMLPTPSGPLIGISGSSMPAAARETERYRPPVDAPITDRFRPPAEDWLPGNRGIKYTTEPGSSVTAIGPGTVTYAGRIGSDLHATITHPDGLRSSYSYLASVRLAEGDRVRAGDLVGTSGDILHLGIRDGDRYLDPESIIGTLVGSGSVRLVPLDEPRNDAVGPRVTEPGFVARMRTGVERRITTLTRAVRRGTRAHWGDSLRPD